MGILDRMGQGFENEDVFSALPDDSSENNNNSYGYANQVFPDDIINITAETLAMSLTEASLSYSGEMTADAVINFLINRTTCGYDLKNLLKRIFINVYADNKDEIERCSRKTDINMKSDNIDFFKGHIFVDGTGSDGVRLDDIIKKPEPEQPDEVPENESHSDIFDETENAEFENPFSDDIDYPAGYGEGLTASEVFNSEFSLDSHSDDDSTVFNTKNNETSDENSEQTNIGIYPENDSLYDISDSPENLSQAQDYYNSIKENITDVSDADYETNGVWFETERKNEIVSGVDISINNNIKAAISMENDDVCEDFCIISDLHGNIVLLGSFICKKGENDINQKYYIEAKAENIDFSGIKSNGTQFSLIWTNKNKNHFYSGTISLRVKTMEASDKILCIDFGSSNTTAGTYTDKGIKIVKFQDVTTPDHRNSNLCPTLVYINKIISKNPDTDEAQEIEYLFGFDAKKVLIENSYIPNGKMFFEIKRWIVNPDKYVEIKDNENNEAKIKRAEIIKAYINYILKCSENYFKCRFKTLHFSAPVKLKSDFISFLKNYVFADSDYQVMSAEESIDEGVAIVYNHISKNIISTEEGIRNRQLDENDCEKSENIIIIDCGGGTTDLVNCNYCYQKTELGYDLELRTKFVNGNSNFGGNNITYRIFQLLKIKLSDYYSSKTSRSENIKIEGIDQLINSNQNDILNDIDISISNNSPMKIYEKLDEKSKLCEDFLPTDFNGNKNYMGKNTNSQVMRNFYLLWQLAEEVKIEFFSKTDCAYINLNDNKDVISISQKDWFFYIKNPDGDIPPLKSTKKIDGLELLPEIEINTNEITTLIRPDIYYLLSTISDFDMGDHDWIKLSGQSCQISLFLDLLKEFVPGRKLRIKNTNPNNSENNPVSTDNSLSEEYSSRSEKLKLKCIEGCIAYVRDKTLHLINPRNLQISQSINHDVYIARSTDSTYENILFRGDNFSDAGYSEPLHIEQYNAVKGTMYIYVKNNISRNNSAEQPKPLEIPIFCNNEEFEPINLESDECYSLRDEIISNAYYGIENYMIHGSSDEKESIIDRLISDIKDIEPVSVGTVLVFAVPNRDGYGFILYQVLKTLDDGMEKYCFHKENKPFESGIMTKSFFSGNNCGFVSESEDEYNA